MSTGMLNPARVSPQILPGDAIEIPALPTVPDPVSRVEEPVLSTLPIEEVEAEAYRLFIDRGGEHGHDVEDWLAAEALVRARML